MARFPTSRPSSFGPVLSSRVRSIAYGGAQTEPALLQDATGESEPVTVRLHDMPVLKCSAGHRQFVKPEFARKLVEHLIGEGEARLPAGEEKGLLFKHYHCSSCGAELGKQSDRRETFSIDVALPDYTPFRVELSTPVYRCPQCSREQVHSLKEVRSHTPEALAYAFRAAEIPPA